jgi:hypothetical protein
MKLTALGVIIVAMCSIFIVGSTKLGIAGNCAVLAFDFACVLMIAVIVRVEVLEK